MRYFFRNTPPCKLNFLKLYVKSPDWVPDDAHKKIELALTTFETATNSIFKKSRHVKHVYNLHPLSPRRYGTSENLNGSA
jgi:hypothetical protein